jgi:hypothetical protein
MVIRILFCAGFLGGANVEAFDGVYDFGSLPGKHQLRKERSAGVISEPPAAYQVRIRSGTSGVRQHIGFRNR